MATDSIVASMGARSADHLALGRAIRQLRERQGISQEALADLAGMHRTYVGGIERGERNVSFANLLKLADALGVPVSALMSQYEAEVRPRSRKR